MEIVSQLLNLIIMVENNFSTMHWHNMNLHLNNAVAWYLAGCQNCSSIECARANVLLCLIEAFISEDKQGAGEPKKHDYFFVQSMNQLKLGTGLKENLISKEINYLIKEGFIEKRRRGSSEGNSYRLNFAKIIAMFEYLNTGYISWQKDELANISSNIESKKEASDLKRAKWEKISTICAEKIYPEQNAYKDISDKELEIMAVIYRGILTYRKVNLKWSEASYNTLFGKNSTYKIGVNSDADVNRLLAACNPENEKLITKGKAIKNIITKVSRIYKELSGNMDDQPILFKDGKYTDDVNLKSYEENKSLKSVY